jgi:single-strand DNA-binding protein
MNNTVILIGNIVRNIELRMTPNGKSTCNITLAVKRNYKNANNEYDSDFINCKAFGSKAELIDKYCKKGDTIGIKGNIMTGSYEKEGKKVYTTDVMIEDVSFIKQAKTVNEEDKKEDKLDKAVNEFKEEADFDKIGLADDGLPF